MIATASYASGEVKLIVVEAEPRFCSIHLLVKVFPKHSSSVSVMTDSNAPHYDGMQYEVLTEMSCGKMPAANYVAKM